MNQPTREPTRKVAVGGAAGLVTAVAVCAAHHYGVDVDGLVAALGPVVVSWVSAYAVPERDVQPHDRDVVVPRHRQ